VIPTRSNQRRLTLDRVTYRRRNVVERCIGWLKWCRRIATRYEKLAESYLAMITLAMIQCCNRLLEPSDRTWRATGSAKLDSPAPVKRD
jgi:transposase